MIKMQEKSGIYIQLIERDMESYPPTLQAKHISEYLGVGLGTAYKLLKSGKLPVVNVPDSKFILVPKSLFIAWYAKMLSGQEDILDGKGENDV